MSATMLDCPACNSTGKQIITVRESGYRSAFEMKCIVCGGNGKTSPDRIAEVEASKNIWCKCENSSGSTYIPDHGSQICRKHHYVCKDCGKITQIG
jgi:transposase-like protein